MIAPRFLTTTVLSIVLSTSANSADELPDPADYGIEPIPQNVQVNDKKAELGNQLYHDTLLSKDGKVSCAACHDLKKGGVDRKPVSTGIGGQKGGVNSPTVYNSEHNFVQFWDGRAKDLAAQALGPVENPIEMGESWENVVQKLSASATYSDAFNAIYEDGITKENAVDAIAEFEKTLITPDSKFDRFLRGEATLSIMEKRGWTEFVNVGCVTCHNGTYLGGNSYQAMSEEYFTDRGGEITEGDLGRYNVTKDEADKHLFKVPMLRNVAVTAPYYHDGQVKTLQDAVKKMAKYQLGEDLKGSQVSAIVAFLKTLTGKYDGKTLR